MALQDGQFPNSLVSLYLMKSYEIKIKIYINCFIRLVFICIRYFVRSNRGVGGTGSGLSGANSNGLGGLFGGLGVSSSPSCSRGIGGLGEPSKQVKCSSFIYILGNLNGFDSYFEKLGRAHSFEIAA